MYGFASPDVEGRCIPGSGAAADRDASMPERKGRNGQDQERERELLLAANSASSSKMRHGGSVYDLLVAEIKVSSCTHLCHYSRKRLLSSLSCSACNLTYARLCFMLTSSGS